LFGAYGKCNYSYVSNTITTYYNEADPKCQDPPIIESFDGVVTGAYKDDDTKYSLLNLLKKQEQEGCHEG